MGQMFTLFAVECSTKSYQSTTDVVEHRRSQGGQGTIAPKFLAYLVILCFEKRHPNKNTAARLKSNILAPHKILDWLRLRCGMHLFGKSRRYILKMELFVHSFTSHNYPELRI